MGCVHTTGSSECSPPGGSRDSSSPGEESVYSQIRPPAIPHTCPHGNNGELKERRVELEDLDRMPGHTGQCPANLTVRSAQSLSSKYSDRRPDPAAAGRRHIRKNASLCVRWARLFIWIRHVKNMCQQRDHRHICKNFSQLICFAPPRQELGHTCHPPAPPCLLPDGSQISEWTPFNSKILTITSV